MKKFLAAVAAVVLLGAGCAGGGAGGGKAASGDAFNIYAYSFNLPDKSWRALPQEDSSRVNLFTKNGKAIMSMSITLEEPTGSPAFSVAGGDYYKGACEAPMICYMYWNKSDDAVWNIKVDPEDETVATEAQVLSILKSITKKQ